EARSCRFDTRIRSPARHVRSRTRTDVPDEVGHGHLVLPECVFSPSTFRDLVTTMSAHNWGRVLLSSRLRRFASRSALIGAALVTVIGANPAPASAGLL